MIKKLIGWAMLLLPSVVVLAELTSSLAAAQTVAVVLMVVGACLVAVAYLGIAMFLTFGD